MTTSNLKTCPACRVPMQAFQADRRMELDRCLRCGGLWFDAGELEAVTGQFLPITRHGRPSERPCARCNTPMEQAGIKTMAVETCQRCRGFYLDNGEFERIAATAPPGVSAALPSRAPAPTSFACGKCARRFRAKEACEHDGLLYCRDCFLEVSSRAMKSSAPTVSFTGGWTAHHHHHSVGWDVADVALNVLFWWLVD